MALPSPLPTAIVAPADPVDRVRVLLGERARADARCLLGEIDGGPSAAQLAEFAAWVEQLDALSRARQGVSLAELGLGDSAWDGFAVGESVAEFYAGAIDGVTGWR